MKVLVRATPQYKKASEKIVAIIKKAGHKVDATTAESPNKDEYSTENKEIIARYDLLFIEASQHTAQLGFEIGFALDKNIPVIVVYHDETGENPLFPLMSVKPDSKLIIRGYKEAEFGGVVKKAVQEIENYFDNRFTMILSPQISEFLNWVSNKMRTTRSDYVRSLIESALKKNTEYKKYLKGSTKN